MEKQGSDVAPGSSPAPRTPDAPLRISAFHKAIIQHEKEVVTLQKKLPDATATPADLQAFAEGEETCKRLAILWGAMGYRVERVEVGGATSEGPVDFSAHCPCNCCTDGGVKRTCDGGGKRRCACGPEGSAR